MWQPNLEGVNELIKVLGESNSTSNEKQSEIFNKINLYSQEKDFSNYLMFIFSYKEIPIEIRQKSGLTLKGIMERSFANFNEENIAYFKQKVLENYSEENSSIKKITSILINTFITLDGVENWQDLINFLMTNLSNPCNYEMSMETIQIILEDSGSYFEDKYLKHLKILLHEIISFIENSHQKITSEKITNEKLLDLNKLLVTLSTLHILIDNCPNVISNDHKKIALILLKMNQVKNMKIRMHLSYCWNSLIRFNKEIFYEIPDQLFTFFVLNFKFKDHELSFSSSEFFHHILYDDEEICTPPEKLQKLMEARIHELIPFIIENMRMDESDISALDNRIKEDKCAKDSQDLENDENDFDYDEELGCKLSGQNYNPNWTLRKCSAKILDRFSNWWPKWTIDNTKSFLEIELQNDDWINKEKAILALGALAVGCYELLKPHLSCIIPFIIKELQHPNKFVRAITCWTISRFTRFILIDNLSDNAFDLFKEYLGEILKRFLDSETIVQEAACTAFSVILITKREKVEPFLFDIFKIVVNVFKKNDLIINSNNNTLEEYNLLNLYEIFSLLTENFEEAFRNENICAELVECVFKIWIQNIKNYKEINENNNDELLIKRNNNLSVILDMIISYVKSSSYAVSINLIGNFLEGTLEILKINYDNYINNINLSVSEKEKDNKLINNYLDKEVITKCFDLLSNIYSAVPAFMLNFDKKNLIVTYLYKYLDLNENYLSHYCIALLGDIARNDKIILKDNINYILGYLINNLEMPDLTNKNTKDPSDIEMEKLSLCNNSCWTLGIIAISYPEFLKDCIHILMKKLTKIISLPRLNKSLAQNVCISIGRFGNVLPEIVSNYLDQFLKQFCLSLRNIKDSQEKQEAFIGLCKSIIHNPNGVINYLAFFCDAICQYENPNEELDRMFKNLIFSYRNTLQNKWFDYFNKFPQRLKVKMTNRFIQA